MDREESPAQIVLHPIGVVRNDVSDPRRRNWGKDTVSEIVLNGEFEAALDGIEDFSHLLVLFWIHRLPPEARATIKTHPQQRPELPLVGIFATRSPARPNPLGVAVVKLLKRQGNVLQVIMLDALDGSPVLDIKPYLAGDSLSDLRVPDWIHKLGNLQ